jgi:phospholipid/cholesterol/gamma-HCH transport system substrate-binding protein
MVQSTFSNSKVAAAPKRNFSIEFFVGLFTLIGCIAGGWLAVGLGGATLFSTNTYTIYAEFDNISGLKEGASVEIAGVQIGTVTDLKLKDPSAIVALALHKGVSIYEDDIAAIRTKGIIGDRYIKISRGGAGELLNPEGTITETESVVDIEDLIGKIVHTMSSGNDDKKHSEDK